MFSGAVAIGLGLVVGFLLFVPFVAIAYRRRGHLSFGRLLLWGAALIYFWAIWTYTLLPLPDGDDIRCVGMVTDPLEIVRELRGTLSQGSRFVRDPAFLQIALNVVLFLPLGFFVRVLGGRGIFVAFAAGLGLSMFVETTQLTGVWGLYPCAYRVFDVGDLMTNTLGALVGSVIGFIVPRVHRGSAKASDADAPRPVTKGRRALAMLCDGIAFALIGYVAGVGVAAVRLYLLELPQDASDGTLVSFWSTLGTAAIWLIVVLATGQTIGDATVRLRYRGGRVPQPIARLLRWAAGYAGISLLGLFVPLAVPALVFASILLLLFTRRGRGLPGLVSGQQLTDSREKPAPAPEHSADAEPDRVTSMS